MNKPRGWRYESERHALAARGIPTTMESRGIPNTLESTEYDLSGNFDDLHGQMSGLVNGVERGDPESMESFILFADEIINNAENLGLGREKYIRYLKKTRSNIERALADSQFYYKYLKKTYRPFEIGNSRVRTYRNKVTDELFYVFTSHAPRDFKMKLKNMELRRRSF